MSTALHRRVREIRARAEIRKWEYRQRNHAKGVWFRLRRVLADAELAYGLDDEEMEQLLAEGFCLEAVGGELQPVKRILFVTEARLRLISGRREIPVRLGPELLGERNLALLRFEEG